LLALLTPLGSLKGISPLKSTNLGRDMRGRGMRGRGIRACVREGLCKFVCKLECARGEVEWVVPGPRVEVVPLDVRPCALRRTGHGQGQGARQTLMGTGDECGGRCGGQGQGARQTLMGTGNECGGRCGARAGPGPGRGAGSEGDNQSEVGGAG
jgi:hypothetical protein